MPAGAVRRSRAAGLACVLVVAATTAACGASTGTGDHRAGSPALPAASLAAAGSCDGLLAAMDIPPPLPEAGHVYVNGRGELLNLPIASTGTQLAAQVEVVSPDEEVLDVVASDGSHVFAMTGDAVHVVRLVDLAEVARIPVHGTGSRTDGVVLDGRRLLVLTGGHTAYERDDRYRPASDSDDEAVPLDAPVVVAELYDVADPAHPRLVDTATIDGEVVAAELVGRSVRLVTAYEAKLPVPLPRPGETWGELERRGLELMERVGARRLLPRVVATGEAGERRVSPRCTDVLVSSEADGPRSVALHSIDLDRGLLAERSTVVLAPRPIVESSGDTTVLAVASTRPGRALPDGTVVPVEEGALQRLVDSGAARWLHDWSSRVAGDTWWGVVAGGNALAAEPDRWRAPVVTSTSVHAVREAAGAGFLPVGSARVEGAVVSGTAGLAVHDGLVRVLTRAGHGRQGTSPESTLTTLGLDDGLPVADRLPGLGVVPADEPSGPPAAVIGRQVAHLAVGGRMTTVDLTGRSARVASTIALPARPSALHPLDDGLVVGLGQHQGPVGGRLGTEMVLVDAADPSAVRLVDSATFGGLSSSEAESDPRALGLDPRDGRLFLPFHQWWGSATDAAPRESFTGALVVQVQGGPLTEQARLTHLREDGRTGATIHRTLVLDDALVTVSADGVARHTLDGSRTLAWRPFHRPEGG